MKKPQFRAATKRFNAIDTVILKEAVTSAHFPALMPL